MLYYIYRHGSGLKMGVLDTGQVKREVLCTGQVRKRAGLRHWSDQKGGSLLRHIPVLDIYMSAPPGGGGGIWEQGINMQCCI